MLVWQMFISSLKWEIQKPSWQRTIPDAEEVDLILVGATGLNAFERLLVGSSSEYILRHAKVDLLVVREQEKNLINTKKKELSAPFCLLFISLFMAFISLELALQFLFNSRFWSIFFFPIIWFQDFVGHWIEMSLTIWKFPHIGLMNDIKNTFWIHPHQDKTTVSEVKRINQGIHLPTNLV